MLSIDKPVVSRQVASMSMNESDFTISFQYNFLYLMRVEQAARSTIWKLSANFQKKQRRPNEHAVTIKLIFHAERLRFGSSLVG